MKKIWILNHFATNMFFNQGGRHYWFAKNLIDLGYDSTIFCANTRHNNSNFISIKIGLHTKKIVNNIPFYFIKTSRIKKTNISRIINFFIFYKNLLKTGIKLILDGEKPDIILASSVHPLTLIAGLKLGKRFNIPVICEIRDLWPESLVAYGIIKKNNPILKFLYNGEKWIYKNADALIFTWEGGKEYILSKRWENEIKLNKIHHINNGIDLLEFYRNQNNYLLEDEDLFNYDTFKIIYTGSIRRVNNLKLILDVANHMNELGYIKIQFLIYGEGNEKKYLEGLLTNKINIKFKGSVEKKYIPFILNHADINLLHNNSTGLDKYGQSQNKLFEYLAAGKPILQTYTTGFSLLEEYNAGIMSSEQTVSQISHDIVTLYNSEELRKLFGKNAKIAAKNFDFSQHTSKLLKIIRNIDKTLV